MTLPVAPAKRISTPLPALPTMRLRAAGAVPPRVAESYAVAAVAHGGCAVGQQAEEIALDDVVRAADEKGFAAKARDGQATDRGPPRALELQADRGTPRHRAVKPDLEDRVVADGQRVRRRAWLGVAVDDHRVDDRRQRRRRRDGLDAAAGDGELDEVRPTRKVRGEVGVEDGLAQRARAAVGGRRDREVEPFGLESTDVHRGANRAGDAALVRRRGSGVRAGIE